MLEVVHQSVVNLIRDENQVVLLGEVGDFEQYLAAGHSTCRIIGIGHKDGLRVGRDGCTDACWIDLELVLHASYDLDRNASGHDHLRLIGDKTGGRNDHLVAGVKQCRHREVQGFRDPHGDHHLLHRVVANAVEFVEVICKGLTKSEFAVI